MDSASNANEPGVGDGTGGATVEGAAEGEANATSVGLGSCVAGGADGPGAHAAASVVTRSPIAAEVERRRSAMRVHGAACGQGEVVCNPRNSSRLPKRNGRFIVVVVDM